MKSKKVLALLLMVLLALFGFAACGGNSGSSSDADSSDAADATEEDAADAVGPGGVAGFEEFSIGDDQELGPLNVAGVYFQPVDMEPSGNSLSAADSDFHIEADISALEGNDLGYGAGDFVPNLTVDYEITGEDGNVVSGAFMPMSASDGPHYGANVSIGGKVGTYHVKFIIQSPEAQGYLLHTDKTTGVEGRFWTEPLVAEWDFEYTGPQW